MALPDNAIVIRGGILADVEHMIEQAEDACRELGEHLLTVWCDVQGPDETVEDVVDRIIRASPIENRRIRRSTVGRLRAAGFTITQTGSNPLHHSVHLGNVPTDAVIGRFVECFDEPEPNPVRH